VNEYRPIAEAIIYSLAGWWCADAIGGLYHLATDRGYNLPFQVKSFQNHHEKPWTMTFDLEPLVGAIPLMVLAWYLQSVFLSAMALGIGFTQVPHYYVHHAHKCPRWITWLQWTGLILQPDRHRSHHTPPHEHNFCILAGWSDWWINPLARVTR
jgi:hypothetical protein